MEMSFGLRVFPERAQAFMSVNRWRATSKALFGGRVEAFVLCHHLAWEVGMTVLSLAYVGVAAYADDHPSPPLTDLLLGFSGVFLTEFLVRWSDAPSRWHYFRAHALDLVSCLPLIGVLRGLRILRLLRLAAGLRVLATASDLVDQRHKSRDSFWFLLPSVAVVWFAGAYAFWIAEHGVNHSIHTFADALYWTLITITTVGYGDISPVTLPGRMVAGALIFVGIGLLGFVSARITAMWLHQGDQTAELVDEVRALAREVASLRALLEEQRE